MALSLKTLLGTCGVKGQPLQECCRQLLGNELFGALFSPDDTAATRSKIRSGYPAMGGRYKNAERLLRDQAVLSQSTGQIKSWWQIHRVEKAEPVRALLHDDAELQAFLQSERGHALRVWVDASFPLFQTAWQPELMTVLTLFAVTRTAWSSLPELLPLPPFPTNGPDGIPPELKRRKRSGLSLYRQKRYEEALNHLRDSFRSAQDSEEARSWNGDIHFWLAAAYLGLWEREQDESAFALALDALDAACELGNPEARLETAKLCLRGDLPQLMRLKHSWGRAKGVSLCRSLIYTASSDPIRGEAFWLLYQVSRSRERNLLPADGESPEQYLEGAFRCGYPPEALQLYRKLFPVSVVLPPARSQARGAGCCICNDRNRYTELLMQTVPEAWRFQALGERASAPVEGAAKYMLFSDDTDRNMHDCLQLLQRISEGRLDRRPEIYLRGDEFQLAPLLDTALNHMGERWVPVHVVDDDKRSAQLLLGRHPLLYPLLTAPAPAKTLHFLIVGSGRCCQWLAREALWMLTLREENVSTGITLVGPHAEDDLETLRFQCPGLRSGGVQQAGFVTTQLDACNCSASYFALTQILSDAVRAGEALYLAVDIGSDRENLDMAIRLREESMRAQSWVHGGTPALPVIAFRCHNTAIADLGRSSVVVNEAGGLGWYNNYGLIPFGTDRDYSWDALTDSVFEKLAWRCHLAYSGLRLSELGRPEMQAAEAAARKDYYTRTYNRDSSMAAALSLPYLLLQTRLGGGPLRPEAWSIQDGEAFFSEENRLRFLRKLQSMPRDDDASEPWSETQLLTEWEHARWCRYMISRGWVGATPEEAEAYCRAGNPRQQLYIGRMHPGITPYARLAELEKHLRATVGLDRNFRKSSRMVVEQLAEILAFRD